MSGTIPAKGSALAPVQEEWFTTTHWSVVLAAGGSDSAVALEALEKLCQTYWYPVYAFIRRQGYDPDQAKDLTQELFYQLIEKRSVARADCNRGRFRSFLLGCARNFVSQHWRKEHTLKRGGHFSFVPMHEAEAENCYRSELADAGSPEKLFDLRWALTVLEQAMQRLKAEYAEARKSDLFEALQVFLSGASEASASYAQVGAPLGLSESAARQAAYRMRCRFGELLRMQVAQTVTTPAELEAEMIHLRTVFSSYPR